VQAHERPVGGQLVRLERTFRRVPDHERRPVLAQNRVHVGHEPALMPELETVATCGQTLERRCQAFVIALERPRQLPEHRSELGRVDERIEALVEELDPAGQLCQPLDVREVPARLHGQDEAWRRLLHPCRHR